MKRRRRIPSGIVRGQPIAPVKLELAKQLRRDMTREERLLWSELRRNRRDGLHFRRQQIICGFIVDFYCDGARLAVELDGAHHNADEDAERDRALERAGVTVVRIENKEVRADLAAICERIAICARERIPKFLPRLSPLP
jgi:very-short-patch-repair endonuclease